MRTVGTFCVGSVRNRERHVRRGRRTSLKFTRTHAFSRSTARTVWRSGCRFTNAGRVYGFFVLFVERYTHKQTHTNSCVGTLSYVFFGTTWTRRCVLLSALKSTGTKPRCQISDHRARESTYCDNNSFSRKARRVCSAFLCNKSK